MPLGDRVLVERVESFKSSAGILLPTADGALNEGKVVAVGPGARNSKGEIIPMQVKEGDNVVLPDYAKGTMEIDGKKLVLVRDDEVLGIMQE